MKPEDCTKLDTCFKISMIQDKDMVDFQYSEAIREVCAKCTEGELTGIVSCLKCGAAMLRAEMYDPEGTAPLYGGIRQGKSWWVCINPGCEDGRRNRGKDEGDNERSPKGLGQRGYHCQLR